MTNQYFIGIERTSSIKTIQEYNLDVVGSSRITEKSLNGGISSDMNITAVQLHLFWGFSGVVLV
jgi:hypothetical protein